MLTYSDVAPSSTSAQGRSGPSLGKVDDDAGDSLADDNLGDDEELLDLNRRFLVHLRNPGSSHRAVARACFALHQRVYAADHYDYHSAAPAALPCSPRAPLQIESSSIYHIQRHQRLVRRILSSLKACLSSHGLPPSRVIASGTLASIARASYARLRFDARLASVRLHPSVSTRLEDECGNGVAYALAVAAIEQGDDRMSSASLGEGVTGSTRLIASNSTSLTTSNYICDSTNRSFGETDPGSPH